MYSDRLFAIRVEANHRVGFGHMVRCFALAKKLTKKNAIVVFLTDSEIVLQKCFKLNLACIKCEEDMIAAKQIISNEVTAKHKTLIIDNKDDYSESLVCQLQSIYDKVIFIENISLGTNIADLVIFPAAHFSYEEVYKKNGLTFNTEKICHGPEYVLIRDEICALVPNYGGGLVVTTGASDPMQVMKYLEKILINLKIPAHFLIGEKFDFSLLCLENKHGVKYSNYSPDLISNADIVISTFGVSVYEALYFKKRVISVGHNLENSVGSKILAARTENLIDVGYFKALTEKSLHHAIRQQERTHYKKDELSIDGCGATNLATRLLQ